MASGKQILLSILQEYSQSQQSEEDLERVSDRVRAALMVHCSTAADTWFKVGKMGWLSEERDGELIRQGLGVSNSGIFLSDLFEAIVESGEIPEAVKKKYPNFSKKDYSDATDIMWWLFSSLQFWEELSSVENDGTLLEDERKSYMHNYGKKWALFKKDPYGYLEISDSDREDM